MEYYTNVKFKNNNKTYFFKTEDQSIKDNDLVIVETVIGLELGLIKGSLKPISTLNFDIDIKPILRKATKEDIKQFKQNVSDEKYAIEIFNKYTKELNLDMDLIDAFYTLDKTKILYTYLSNDRVDFRELLKSLATELHCRIELKQINARERAQFIGGLGACGRPTCCSLFINKFESISIARAKNQMLSINIPKLSGTCNKLMCCLKFEDDLYTEAKKNFPSIGASINYEGQEFKLSSYNLLTKILKFDSTEDTIFLTLEESLKYIKNKKRNGI